MTDKAKHIYITRRPMLASLVIDTVPTLALFGVVYQQLYLQAQYPQSWLVTFAGCIVALAIVINARHDTKKITDDSSLLMAVIAGVPDDKLIDVASVVALQAMKRNPKSVNGMGCDIDDHGKKYVMLFSEREAFDALTNGSFERKPDLRVIH